ncbi:14275_t:CDS:2, partial [Acaulospora morrowiae]
MRFFNVLLIVLGALVLWVDAQATLNTALPGTQSPPALSTNPSPNPPTLPNSQAETIITSPNAIPSSVAPSSVAPSSVAPSSIAPSPVTPSPGTSPIATQAPADTPSTVAPGASSIQESTSIADSPTPTTDQTLPTGSSSLSASVAQSSDD